MALTDLPGFRPGATVWNLFVFLIYFSLVALILVATPLLLGIAVTTNYRGAADRLSFLPGITAGGNLKSGFIVFVLTGVLWVVLFGSGSATPEANGNEGPEPANTGPPASETSAVTPTATSTPSETTTLTSTDTVTRTPTSTAVNTPTPSPTPIYTIAQTPTPQTGSGGVEIVYLQADAPGSEYDNLNGETVTIENTGSESVSLDGWTLSEGDGVVYTFDAVQLSSGESIVLHTGSGADTENDLYWGLSSPVWNNNGDTGTLMNDEGEEVDVYSYD